MHVHGRGEGLERVWVRDLCSLALCRKRPFTDVCDCYVLGLGKGCLFRAERCTYLSLSLVFFLLFCFICFGFSDAEVDRQRLKNITLQNRVFESDYLDLNVITTMIYNIYNSHISS